MKAHPRSVNFTCSLLPWLTWLVALNSNDIISGQTHNIQRLATCLWYGSPLIDHESDWDVRNPLDRSWWLWLWSTYVLIVYRSLSIEGHRSWGSNLANSLNFSWFLRYICSIFIPWKLLNGTFVRTTQTQSRKRILTKEKSISGRGSCVFLTKPPPFSSVYYK